MSAYFLFIREDAPTDPAAMETYGAINRANAGTYVEKHGIKPLSVYAETEAFEGEAPDGVILLEFPSMEHARAWYVSPEYQAAIPHRMQGAKYRALLLPGV
jgi:uncharacterized protein (DUF1330 family)